ncbi:MAG: MTAP family purine nucleoside phosphorylase [Thermoplasmata archaeon]|nr:MAG: MTAP family purine nucleoside phosphorylase [Thermoplasmata archaeon]
MVRRIGIIGGTSLVERAKGLELERLEVETPFGHPSSPLHVGMWGEGEVALLVRHGLDHDVPPHRLNHRANVHALRSAGVKKLILVASAGSMREGIEPPTVVLVDDFSSPFTIPTFYDDEIGHIAPVLSDDMRSTLVVVAAEEGIPVLDGAVYVQTRGPRLETRAEVRALKAWGDLLGMTVASEATLAMEIGMEVAVICSVDNMAHGMGTEPLEFETIMANAASNWKSIERLLRAAAGRL